MLQCLTETQSVTEKAAKKEAKLYVPAILSSYKQGLAVSHSSVGVCVSHLFPIVVPCQLPDP